MAARQPVQQLCPSAPGHAGESMLIGVVTGAPGAPRVIPTDAPMPVTQALLDLAQPVAPSEVFRFASSCRAEACTHFTGGACQLAARSVALLPEVAAALPPCAIRPTCRWFRQEGPAICRRCPQIVTEQYGPSAQMVRVVFGDREASPRA